MLATDFDLEPEDTSTQIEALLSDSWTRELVDERLRGAVPDEASTPIELTPCEAYCNV
jgi:hypothetical protein